MNWNRIIRLKLLLLFALLQCIAPVAHAHVNGNNSSQHAHAPIVHSPRLVAHSHDHQDSGSTGISADQHHSAVVSMPPEFRSSLLHIEQPDGPIQHGNVVPHAH